MHIDIILFWSVVTLAFCSGYLTERVGKCVKRYFKRRAHNSRLFKDDPLNDEWKKYKAEWRKAKIFYKDEYGKDS